MDLEEEHVYREGNTEPEGGSHMRGEAETGVSLPQSGKKRRKGPPPDCL